MNFSLYHESWMMDDEVEKVAYEAARVTQIAFEKDKDAIAAAWKRMINALEIIQEEGRLALDEVYYGKKSRDRYVLMFKEIVCAFAEYVIDTRPIVEYLLNEIYMSKMEPVTVWVCLIYIFGFYIMRAEMENKDMNSYRFFDTDEYERVADWMHEHVPEEYVKKFV